MARTSKFQTAEEGKRARSEWRAALYIRLSREDGDKVESESVSSQKAILQAFASEHSLAVGDYYIDDGWSGTDFDRPAFQRMLSDIARKKINCVVVKDLSRFGRNYVEAGKYLETVFPLFNVRFISVNDAIDSALHPQSLNNIVVPFKNIVNDEYCRDISVKVRSALDIRRKQGKFIGSFAAYGYRKDEKDHNKLVADEEAARVVRGIFSAFLAGTPILGIARSLNARGVPNPNAYKAQKGLRKGGGSALWCDMTVRRILKNELYIGNLVQKKNELVSHKIHVARAVEPTRRIKVEHTHEALVSESDFQKAQALLGRDTRVLAETGKLSLFAGFVKCADCGRAMQLRTVKQPNRTYRYYICSTYKRARGACTKHAVRADELEKSVLSALNEYIRIAVDFDGLMRRIGAEKKESLHARGLREELARSEREARRAGDLLVDLYPDYKAGVVDKERYFSLKARYEQAERAALQRADGLRAEIARAEEGLFNENEFVSTFKKYRALKTLTRELVVELIENIYISADGGAEVRLKCKQSFGAARDFLQKCRAEDTAEGNPQA